MRRGQQCYAVNDVRPQLDELLFSSVEGVSVESVEVTHTVVQVEARTIVRRAPCPGCGCWSGRIHGSYLRFPRDVPAVGKFVVVSLRVRSCWRDGGLPKHNDRPTEVGASVRPRSWAWLPHGTVVVWAAR